MTRRMRDRRMRDRTSRRMRDRNYDRAMDYEYYGPEYPSRYDYRSNERYSSSRMGRDSEYDREHSMDYNYYEPMRDYARGRGYTRSRDYRGRDRRYDYGSEEYLTDDELMEWSKDLMQDVEEKDKAFFSKENMERKAKDMGIEFKEFTFPELYTATLMQYTDYHKTLDTGNMDLYVRMAKDWLCDEDAELQYGEKLASYYDNIVEGM